MAGFSLFGHIDMNWIVSILARALKKALIEIYKEDIMATLQELEAQIQNNIVVESSAVLLIQGFKARLEAAGVDPIKLEQLRNDLAASAENLNAAVLANEEE